MTSDSLLARLHRLRPDSERQWGNMSAHQVLPHLTDQIRICLGELPAKPRGNRLTRRLAALIALYLPIPMPKNMKTIAELDPKRSYMTPPTDFQRDFDALLAAYTRMLQLPETHHFEHPVFGKLSKKEVIHLTHLHLDHHLKQFSID